MAGIERLESGHWRARVRLPSGHRISRTDPLRRVVKDWAADTEAAIRNGDLQRAPDRRLTVRAWHEQWQRTRLVDPHTMSKEQSAFRVHILPRFGDRPLASIERSDVQAWVTDLTRAGLSGSYIGTVYRTLVKLLGDAVEDGKLSSSPCRKITLPRESRPVPRWLTEEEYDRIQLALEADPHAPVWRALIGVGCFCGLRPGELGGLDVGWIDFDRQLLRVEQVMTPSGLRDYPKTDASRRSVPFPDAVGALLWAAVADRGPDEPAFPARAGGRLYHSNWSVEVWQPTLRAAGVRYVRPYVMRHTAASWLVQDGVPEQEIAKLLGHGGTRLVKLYAHLAPDAHDRVRAAWAARARGPRLAHDGVTARAESVITPGQDSEPPPR